MENNEKNNVQMPLEEKQAVETSESIITDSNLETCKEEIAPAIDDNENEGESLQKEVVKDSHKKDNTKLRGMLKKVLKCTGIAVAACVVIVIGIATFLAVKERIALKDDTEFVLVNPDDPNSFSNVA